MIPAASAQRRRRQAAAECPADRAEVERGTWARCDAIAWNAGTRTRSSTAEPRDHGADQEASAGRAHARRHRTAMESKAPPAHGGDLRSPPTEQSEVEIAAAATQAGRVTAISRRSCADLAPSSGARERRARGGRPGSRLRPRSGRTIGEVGRREQRGRRPAMPSTQRGRAATPTIEPTPANASALARPRSAAGARGGRRGFAGSRVHAARCWRGCCRRRRPGRPPAARRAARGRRTSACRPPRRRSPPERVGDVVDQVVLPGAIRFDRCAIAVVCASARGRIGVEPRSIDEHVDLRTGGLLITLPSGSRRGRNAGMILLSNVSGLTTTEFGDVEEVLELAGAAAREERLCPGAGRRRR